MHQIIIRIGTDTLNGGYNFIVFMQNVSVEAEARFGADSLERLVRNHFHRLFIPGLKSLHFLRRIRPRQRPGGSSYILFERQGSGDPTPCGGYPGPPCCVLSFLFQNLLLSVK